MELFKRSSDRTISSLIDWGTHGHYPLFDRDWLVTLELAPGQRLRRLSINEKSKVKTILKKLATQSSFERKRTVLFSLSAQDRATFIRAFMHAVEGRILDSSPELH